MNPTSHALEDFKTHLVSEAHEDEVGLWYIVAGLRDDLSITDPAEVRGLTMSIVREMLESGKICAGWYRPDSALIEPWPLNTDQVLARINAEWDALGREPTIAEIVVLQGCDGGQQSPHITKSEQ